MLSWSADRPFFGEAVLHYDEDVAAAASQALQRIVDLRSDAFDLLFEVLFCRFLFTVTYLPTPVEHG